MHAKKEPVGLLGLWVKRILTSPTFIAMKPLLSTGGQAILGLSISMAAFYCFEKWRASYSKSIPKHASDKLKSIAAKNKVKLSLTMHEEVIASNIVSPAEIDVTFDDIGGLDDIKQQLYDTVVFPFKHPELFRGRLLRSPKGILLYGPPGTGKTMLAKAIAKATDAVFLNLDIADVFQKYWGESEKMVQAIFTLAVKLSPSIIFIDEIEAIFSFWDGLSTDRNAQVIVIGATNRPAMIDEAILRRLPQTFLIDLPNQPERQRILEVILRDEKLDEDVDIQELAAEMEGYSGSDLQALCQQAARAPIREAMRQQTVENLQVRRLKQQDFLDAKKVVGATGSAAQAYEAQLQDNSPLANLMDLLKQMRRGNNS